MPAPKKKTETRDTDAPVKQTVEYVVRADRPLSLDPRDPQTPALADVARNDFVLFELTSSKTLDLSEEILTASLDRTIEGASTVKVSVMDKADSLIRHPLLRRNQQGLYRARLVLDSLVWHLVGVARPAARRIDLTFEEQAYNGLRRHDDPLVGSRAKYTRAMFFKRMTDEAGVDLVSPEILVKQRVAAAETPDTDKAPSSDQSTDLAKTTPASDRNREPGFAANAKITIKGQAANAEQRANLALSLSIARALGAGPLATLAMVTSGIGESNWLKGATDGVTGTHVGVFQSNQIPAADLKAQTIHFLQGGRSFLAGGAIGYAKANPGASPGTIASRVEISDGSGAFYDAYANEARKIIALYTGGSADLEDPATAGVLGNDADDTGGGSYAVPYEFSRGEDGQREDSATCMRRLADEVAWYFFVCAGTAYFVSGDYLLRSRPRMLVAPGEDGIELVTFTIDESDQLENSVTVQCRARRWQAPPGSVVDVDGYGDADGRWLVGQISRPKLFTSDLATITLVPAKKKKPEPAHEVRQRAANDADAAPSSDDPQFTTNPGDSGTSSGSWKYQPGVPNTLNSKMRSFMDRMATFYDGTIVVTTTTNHDYLTSSGNVSDHNGGGAADLGSVANWGGQLDGEGGFKLAIAAHRACGESYETAVRNANKPSFSRFTSPEGGVQILWRVDGHHDHVHIGI